MSPSSCLDGGITLGGPGWHPQYPSASTEGGCGWLISTTTGRKVHTSTAYSNKNEMMKKWKKIPKNEKKNEKMNKMKNWKKEKKNEKQIEKKKLKKRMKKKRHSERRLFVLLCGVVARWENPSHLFRNCGGYSRFIPGTVGPHLSWRQCCYGDTCRPLESPMAGCLAPLLDLLGYSARAVAALSKSALRVRFCSFPFAGRLPPWKHGDGSDAFRTIHVRLEEIDAADGVHHPLPDGVNDTPRAIRKRLTSKTHPSYIRLREASPPPKRRKGSFFPGRSRGFQEGDLFPRIGMGWSGVRRLNPRNWFPEAWGLSPVTQSDRREGTWVPSF